MTDIQRGHNQLYVYGPSGFGKSHHLAALVCRLVADGEHVFYIPYCRRLVEVDIHVYIQHALLFALHNHCNMCFRIRAATTVEVLLAQTLLMQIESNRI